MRIIFNYLHLTFAFKLGSNNCTVILNTIPNLFWRWRNCQWRRSRPKHVCCIRRSIASLQMDCFHWINAKRCCWWFNMGKGMNITIFNILQGFLVSFSHILQIASFTLVFYTSTRWPCPNWPRLSERPSSVYLLCICNVFMYLYHH